MPRPMFHGTLSRRHHGLPVVVVSSGTPLPKGRMSPALGHSRATIDGNVLSTDRGRTMAGTARIARELIVDSDDDVGLLARITGVLYERGINITSVSARTEGGGASVHLMTEANGYAKDALSESGYRVEEREVVVVELANRRGFLNKVNETLARKDVSIVDLQLTAAESCERALVVFSTSNNTQAVQLLHGW
ncbi:MAG: ACT domain-containing protein [Candidatus Bipolaricaulota bacterium]|nr:MAG: ACT domain-containing protein [Candidatus Bipolaricaulota bacterium]